MLYEKDPGMPERRSTISEILWSPPEERRAASAMTVLMASLAETQAAPFDDDLEFHRWTVNHPQAFWSFVWKECGVTGDPGGCVVHEPDRMPGARWFPGSDGSAWIQ